MVNRHRIPSIFNLSMVDVLCCALGCVILLWLLNLRQARQSGSELTQTQIELADQVRESQRLHDELRQAAKEYSQVQQALAVSQARLLDLEEALADLRRDKKGVENNLAAAKLRGDTLAENVREHEAAAQAMSSKVRDLSAKLRSADDRLRTLRTQADLVPGLRDRAGELEARALRLENDLAARRRDLSGLERSVKSIDTSRNKLQDQLAARERELLRLNDDKKSLQNEVRQARAVIDTRFAGITLVGRRVVFLVDMSGSMELIDPSTSAPNKWVGVRETLGKVMRSLPALEKYQVILFSDKVIHPLGSEGAWLDYQGPASATKTVEAIAAIKPKGGTNLYAGLEAAFKLRDSGLDALYVFSDGLPNQGPGLSAEQAANIKEIERGVLLGKHIRQTLSSDWNRARPGRVKVPINAVGFFYESPDVGAFLWALARENEGSFVGMSKP